VDTSPLVQDLATKMLSKPDDSHRDSSSLKKQEF